MALTNTALHRGDVFGNRRVTVTNVLFDNSYTTGGKALLATDLGLRNVRYIIPTVQVPAGAVTSLVYDATNGLLKAFTAAAEVANAVDLSALQVQVVAVGY